MTNVYSSIKCTYCFSNNAVTFFDLQLAIYSNHIKACIYFKPTDLHNYLLFSSSYPPSCKHSIPFSQLLGIKCFMTMMFSSQPPIKSQITSLNANTPSISSNKQMMMFCQWSMGRIPLILTFHHSICPLRRIILRHYKTLMTDQNTTAIFNLLPITLYKHVANSNNHLFHALHPQQAVCCDTGTYSCKSRLQYYHICNQLHSHTHNRSKGIFQHDWTIYMFF